MLQHAAANGMPEYARVHAGGLFKIEPRGLSKVPLFILPTLALAGIERQLPLLRVEYTAGDYGTRVSHPGSR